MCKVTTCVSILVEECVRAANVGNQSVILDGRKLLGTLRGRMALFVLSGHLCTRLVSFTNLFRSEGGKPFLVRGLVGCFVLVGNVVVVLNMSVNVTRGGQTAGYQSEPQQQLDDLPLFALV